MAAQKPDGKRPTGRVGFTRQSADRIAKVVRTIEQGDRKGAGLSFGSGPRSFGGGGSTLVTSVITVLTFAELTTASLTFDRSEVIVVGQTTASSISIGIEQCPSVAVSAEGQAFFYG